MKLEFFADAFEGEGLLLLYEGAPSEVERLREQVRQLEAVPGTSVVVQRLDFVHALDSCELTLTSVESGQGVDAQVANLRFDLRLPPSDWRQVVELLEPFCQAAPNTNARFQYLHDHGGIEVIYSTDRGW